MTITPPFTKLASFYNDLYRDKNYTLEAEQIIRHLSERDIKTGRILSVGCGTGRYEVQFAKRGFSVTGIDRSSEMLSFANSIKEQQSNEVKNKLHFINSDLLHFESTVKFDAVLILFHVVNYLKDLGELETALSSLKKHMQPGSVILFDSWNGSGIDIDPPKTATKQVMFNSGTLERITVPSIDYKNHKVDLNIKFILRNPTTQKIEHHNEKHSLCYFYKEEILSALEKNCFYDVKISNDFTFSNDLTNEPFSLSYSAKLNRN